jgi:hypothetical protein
MRGPVENAVVVAMVGMMAGSLLGCAGAGHRDEGARARSQARQAAGATASAQRQAWALPVWPRTTLVVPWDGDARRLDEPVRVTGSRGVEMPAALWQIWVEPSGADWPGAISAWHAEQVRPEEEASLERARAAAASGMSGGRVSWLVVAIDVPAGFYDEQIVVDGKAVRVAPSPELLESAWVSPMPPYADWDTLLDAARGDETSPMTRWRARLLRAGVPDDPTRPVHEFASPLLEALAVQEELRWRTALSRLHRASEELSRRVRERVLPVVTTAQSGLTLPLWTRDGESLAQLKHLLLDERATPAMLAGGVESWLRRQPESAAWFEHAFAQDAPGAPAGFVRAWAGNVSGREVLAWMEFRAERPVGAPVPEPVLLAPGELRLLEAPVVIPEGVTERVTVAVHAGARVERGDVVIGAIAAEPPGLTLGPLMPAHDAGSILGGQAVSMEGGVCAATLRRLDPAGPSPRPAEAFGRWSLLVEYAGDDEPGTITANFAHDGGSTRIEVGEDGGLVVEAPAGLPVSGYPRLVPVVRQSGHWAAEVPVPDWCVGLDGKIRLSLVRRGASGAIWSWPTRVLRLAPERGGRAVIDLRAWDDGSVR